MAKIVAGMGTSHSPVLILAPQRWPERVASEMKSKDLWDRDGTHLSYVELAEKVHNRYASVATVENFVEWNERSQKALDRLASDISEIKPDVVLIVGDDQEELFHFDNLPALAIFYGDTVVSEALPRSESTPQWIIDVFKGYGADVHHEIPAAPELARHLISSLINQDIDVGVTRGVPATARGGGFGHAITYPVVRLMRERHIPIVPVLLNTYYPPNQPTPGRCFDIGKALQQAVESYPRDLRVMVLASGGLSHFVTDEELDRKVLKALCEGDEQTMRDLPVKLLNSGNSEIRNWIVMAGAVHGLGLKPRWHEYVPVYRSPAGTGIGLGFGCWN